MDKYAKSLALIQKYINSSSKDEIRQELESFGSYGDEKVSLNDYFKGLEDEIGAFPNSFNEFLSLKSFDELEAVMPKCKVSMLAGAIGHLTFNDSYFELLEKSGYSSKTVEVYLEATISSRAVISEQLSLNDLIKCPENVWLSKSRKKVSAA